MTAKDPNYLVQAGVTHRLAVRRNGDGTYAMEAWSPSSLISPNTALIVMTPEDRDELVGFLQGEPAGPTR